MQKTNKITYFHTDFSVIYMKKDLQVFRSADDTRAFTVRVKWRIALHPRP